MLNKTLLEAYKKVYSSEPDASAENWQIAKEVLKNWDVPKMGEDLAKETLFLIINHIWFPGEDITREIVGDAEDKLVELFPEIGQHDPDMHIAEWLENKYWEEKKKELKPEEKLSLK